MCTTCTHAHMHTGALSLLCLSEEARHTTHYPRISVSPTNSDNFSPHLLQNLIPFPVSLYLIFNFLKFLNKAVVVM